LAVIEPIQLVEVLALFDQAFCFFGLTYGAELLLIIGDFISGSTGFLEKHPF